MVFDVNQFIEALLLRVKGRLTKFYNFASNKAKLVSEDFYVYEILEILINYFPWGELYSYSTESKIEVSKGIAISGGRAVDLFFGADNTKDADKLQIYAEIKLAGQNNKRILKDLIKLQYGANTCNGTNSHYLSIVISHKEPLPSDFFLLKRDCIDLDAAFIKGHFGGAVEEFKEFISFCHALPATNNISTAQTQNKHRECFDEEGKEKGIDACLPYVVQLLGDASVCSLTYVRRSSKAKINEEFSVYMYCFELVKSKDLNNL